MFARKQIDAAQYRAASWLERQFIRTRSGQGAVDPSNEPVDVSSSPGSVSDAFLHAIFEIKRAQGAVGPQFWSLLVYVCVDGWTIKEIAESRGIKPRKMGKLFRRGLDDLAVHLGYA